jgi:hypothetical protein
MGGRVADGTCGACFEFTFPKDKHWRSRVHSQSPGKCRAMGREVYRDQTACKSYRSRVAIATESLSVRSRGSDSAEVSLRLARGARTNG